MPLPTILLQVRKTLELAGPSGSVIGDMDQRVDGTWTQTLRALQEAGSVDKALTAEQVLAALVPPRAP